MQLRPPHVDEYSERFGDRRRERGICVECRDHRRGKVEEHTSAEDNEGEIGSGTVKIKQHENESNKEKAERGLNHERQESYHPR